MSTSKITEVNTEDIFADISLEIEEIESIIKLICDALESPKYSQIDIKEIDRALFMLQGKLNAVKNNIRIIRDTKSED